MEIKGVIKQILPMASGEGARGPWKKQSFVLEVPGNFPKSVCIDVWGDNIDNFKLTENEEVVAHIDIESREYNGKWYTNVKAWKLDRPVAAQESAPSSDQDMPTNDPYAEMPDEDDLPF